LSIFRFLRIFFKIGNGDLLKIGLLHFNQIKIIATISISCRNKNVGWLNKLNIDNNSVLRTINAKNVNAIYKKPVRKFLGLEMHTIKYEQIILIKNDRANPIEKYL
jgi:hypothetical protein